MHIDGFKCVLPPGIKMTAKFVMEIRILELQCAPAKFCNCDMPRRYGEQKLL